LLERGRIAEGFALYESRMYHPNWVVWAVRESIAAKMDRLLGPLDAVNGRTILVITEQGLGDNIMFARFIPGLAERGALVTVVTEPALAPIMARVRGVNRVLAPPADHPMGKLNLAALAFDAMAPMLSLAHVAGVTATAIPAPIPYLTADPERVAYWRTWLDAHGRAGNRRVGVVAHSNTGTGNAARRSIPIALVANWAAIGGIDLVNLQPGPPGRALAERGGLDPLGGRVVDLAEYAAMLAAMDLVISADTMAAHLAGAQGVRLLVALPDPGDWRWGQAPDVSPWYPGARLFRQHVAEDWTDTVDRIGAYLSDQFA
jgi:hypothetical protein